MKKRKMPLEKEAFFTGTQVNYYVICPTKLWLFSHFLRMEKNSDLVAQGKLLHQTSYRKTKKEVAIDDKIAVDFIRKGDELVLHEVKKTKKMEDAHIRQMQYYLYYLKKKGVDAVGEIDYPKTRENKRVELTPESEREIEHIMTEIKEIIGQEKPQQTTDVG